MNRRALNITGIFLLITGIAFSNSQAQTLNELEVKTYDDPPEAPEIQPDYPEYAYVVILSSIQNLEIESNWRIVADLSEPDKGRYVLVVDPQRQLLRVSEPGFHQETEIQVPELQRRETIYYSVEPANFAGYTEIQRLYEQGNYVETIDRVNAFLTSPNLSRSLQANAYRLLALSLYNLRRITDMRSALRRMLAVDPEYAPDGVGDPSPVRTFVLAYQDSLRRIPPSAPENLLAFMSGDQIRLRWNPNTEPDLAGYKIYKGEDASRKELRATLPAGSPTYLDPDVVPFKRYFYHVSAFDRSTPPSESEPSITVEILAMQPLVRRLEAASDTNSAVRNVHFQQSNDSLITILYQLTGRLHRTYDVKVSLSNNGGRSYNFSPSALTGDHGPNVQDGRLKQIQWNTLAEFPNGLPDERYTLRLEAVPQPFIEQLQRSQPLDAPITSLSISQRGDSLITIDYELPETGRTKYDVQLQVSNNGGRTFAILPGYISGDAGERIEGGSRSIEWNLLGDFPDGLQETLFLRLDAQISPKRSKKGWLLATGGALLAGGATAFLLTQGGGNDPRRVAELPPGRP